MLERLIIKIAKTQDSISESIELVSFNFDKIETIIGNYESTYLLDSLKELESKIKEANDKYDDIIREVDRMNEDVREINYALDSIVDKIPNDVNSLF